MSLNQDEEVWTTGPPRPAAAVAVVVVDEKKTKSIQSLREDNASLGRYAILASRVADLAHLTARPRDLIIGIDEYHASHLFVYSNLRWYNLGRVNVMEELSRHLCSEFVKGVHLEFSKRRISPPDELIASLCKTYFVHCDFEKAVMLNYLIMAPKKESAFNLTREERADILEFIGNNAEDYATEG